MLQGLSQSNIANSLDLKIIFLVLQIWIVARNWLSRRYL